MFTYHYLHPEKMWGVFQNGIYVAIFSTVFEAMEYCNRHNKAVAEAGA